MEETITISDRERYERAATQYHRDLGQFEWEHEQFERNKEIYAQNMKMYEQEMDRYQKALGTGGYHVQPRKPFKACVLKPTKPWRPIYADPLSENMSRLSVNTQDDRKADSELSVKAINAFTASHNRLVRSSVMRTRSGRSHRKFSVAKNNTRPRIAANIIERWKALGQ